ncbi:MAG TPA: dihydroorotase [Candidatus Eremiobacteraceae bacterium]|nr:dihydroorotase [Candidatus Eremiobacteraceae bacterium]
MSLMLKAENRDFVGARVVDPVLGLDAIRTIVVRNGVVTALLDRAPSAADPHTERVDCAGMVLCPGFIDPHVHVREPGETHKETLKTALAAAAAGGFSAVAAMPNTRPAMDDAAKVTRLIGDAAAMRSVRCYPIGAVTRGREGEALAALRSMAAAGAVAFSDDGNATKSLKTLYHAAKLIADLPQPMLSHCEDPSFADALMHEGEVSDLLGVPGSPALAEAAIAARDLLVAQATGKAWHLCHVSTRMTLDVFRWARSAGVRVTAEVTPHHLQCTHELLLNFNAAMRVNPPLRTAADVAALRKAVLDGTVTIFASDHAPHATAEKEPPLSHACVGFSGLETAVAATFDALPDAPLKTMVGNFSSNVAALLNVRGGTLAVGAPADITGLYLDRPWTVEPSNFRSLGKVTPFAGRTFKVRPALTVVGGAIVYRLADEPRAGASEARQPARTTPELAAKERRT